MYSLSLRAKPARPGGIIRTGDYRTAHVHHVKCGTVRTVSCSQLCTVHTNCLQLPFLSCLCSLYSVDLINLRVACLPAYVWLCHTGYILGSLLISRRETRERVWGEERLVDKIFAYDCFLLLKVPKPFPPRDNTGGIGSSLECDRSSEVGDQDSPTRSRAGC